MEPRSYMNIPFAEVEGQALKLDIYRPADEGVYPLILHVHGGGWSVGGRAGNAAGFASYVAQGFVVADIDYRLAPASPYPAACDDVRTAARWLLAHGGEYGADASRMGGLGYSAGAHLVEMLITEANTPLRCAVGWGGPTDMTREPVTHPYRGYAWAFMSACPTEEPALYAEVSPVTRLTAWTPPILHIHGDADGVVPVHHAHLLAEAAVRVGAPVEIIIQAGGGHCVPGNDEDGRQADTRIKAFFVRHLG